MESILSYLHFEDIKSFSLVNRIAFNSTKNYFEKKCVVNIPEIITLDIVEIFHTSSRRYKNAIYKLSRKNRGNLLDQLGLLPFNACIKNEFYWENVQDLETSGNFQVELFSSQIEKGLQICRHVTKINLSHKPVSILDGIFNCFRNVRELVLTNIKDEGLFDEDNGVSIKPQHLKCVKFSFGSFALSNKTLSIFKGLTTIEFKYIQDINFIEALIENNKDTLTSLILGLSSPALAEIQIPCQLMYLEIDSMTLLVSLENLLSLQTHLTSLVLKSPLMNQFLIKFLENCKTLQTFSVVNPKLEESSEAGNVNLYNIKNFRGRVNDFIKIPENLESLETELYKANINFNHLRELKLMSHQTIQKQHSEFECFEDFRDYHLFDPLNHLFLQSISTTKSFKVDWIISLHEFKKIIKELRNLELFHFSVRPQEFKSFYEYITLNEFCGKLRFVMFKIDFNNTIEYSKVNAFLKIANYGIPYGTFLKPFSILFDFDLKSKTRNVIYFSHD